jgi:hypothetical protein
MVKPRMSMLCSVISHMPLLFVWRDSGVTQKHGFELAVDVCNYDMPDQRPIDRKERPELVLSGEYDFLSGLHHDTYIYRAKGDKRFVYVAQAQNDWDDRVIATAEISSPRDLEGKTVFMNDMSPCVLGNLKRSLELADVNHDRIRFVGIDDQGAKAVDAVLRGEGVAANVDIPFDRRAENRGLHRLAVPSLPVIHNCTICANREWVIENEESTLAFLRSMIDAIHFFKTRKDETCAILERTMAPLVGLQGADEIEYLQEGWAELLSAKPYPHPLAVWNVYNLDSAHNPEVNFIGPFEIWDTSYLRTIDDSGYVDELYGGARQAANPPVNPVI